MDVQTRAVQRELGARSRSNIDRDKSVVVVVVVGAAAASAAAPSLNLPLVYKFDDKNLSCRMLVRNRFLKYLCTTVPHSYISTPFGRHLNSSGSPFEVSCFSRSLRQCSKTMDTHAADGTVD